MDTFLAPTARPASSASAAQQDSAKPRAFALKQEPQDRLPFPYRDESQVVGELLRELDESVDWSAVQTRARPWAQAARDNPPPFWAMESLLREYPISSAEGIALMRLAEALLRVPDVETAMLLTADQLSHADFGAHEHSAMARLSNAAVQLSKKFLPDVSGDGEIASASTSAKQLSLSTRLGGRTVVAATLRAVQLLGQQFVLGQNIEEALHKAQSGRSERICYSFDMLGEGARTDADAQRYLESYRSAIVALAKAHQAQAAVDVNNAGVAPQRRDGISIKLSALHPRYEATQRDRVQDELLPRVWQLCELAARADLNLTIDAEECDRLELSLDVFEALAERIASEFPQWRGFGLAIQAYQSRAPHVVDAVVAIARRLRLHFMCRLVKGAYWDTEIKRAQEFGLPAYPVFTHKHHTDLAYLTCAGRMLAAKDCIYAQFATHNAGTIAAIMHMATRSGARFELQRLHGMGEGIYREVLRDPLLRLRVYAPVGRHRDLLAYLVRRLLENGANSSFVNQLGDARVPLETLLASPLQLSVHHTLPLPTDLYGALHGQLRRNSQGVDTVVQQSFAPLAQSLELIRREVQGTALPFDDVAQVDDAVRRARSHQASNQAWRERPVSERAEVLLRAADQLQEQQPHFAALLVQEAFKTWPDAISEVRECVDFLRYYALLAQPLQRPQTLPGPTGEHNELRLGARGVFVCISPWNFPLAIFGGQVAAALATGNAVLAKPAEQTPRVARELVALLHRAGVPSDALHCLHGLGEVIGAALVAHAGIDGVVFTGSNQAAKHIQRALAAKDGPIVPFIAETGGINAMVVDSTALPEQVCDAVLQSAFRSAGQRCSALRLLCLHEAVYSHMLEMIIGGARELRLGEPGDRATDVGPVIDAEAHANLNDYLTQAERQGRLRWRAALPAATRDTSRDAAWQARLSHLVTPAIIEVPHVNEVRREVFGPVLHVVRWSGAPRHLMEQINALGYGLTLGVQSRIDSRADEIAQLARVGNVYVNRNIIGAVVGVQPFGGEGLSGTGPKAGGPHYLARFCTEQTLTINTAAAGGNATLLAGDLD